MSTDTDEVRAARREQAARVRAANHAILGPVAAPLLGASILQALAAVCAVAPYIVVVEIGRQLLAPEPDTATVWTLAIVALALLGARGLLGAAALLWSHLTDATHQFTLRRLLAAKLARVPLGWFGERSSGRVKKTLQDDVAAIHYLIAHARLDVVAAIVAPLLALGYLFWAEWRLALLLLVPLAAYAFAYSRMVSGENAHLLKRYTAWQERIDAATVEFVDGIQVVRTFGQAGRAHRRFQEAVDGYAEFFESWAGPITKLESIVNVILTPAFLLLLSLAGGTAMVALGWIEPLSILPFVFVGIGLGATILNVGFAAQGLQQARDAALRLAALLDEDELTPGAGAATPADGAVEFDGVSFGYDADRRVLTDVAFTLRPGTITALVGPSGSGKSTLAKLLPRFTDPDAGAVRIGGVDVRELPEDELYRRVGFVFQDVTLVAGSIRDNIALGRPGATDAEVEEAARAAQIHERVTQLPRGYDAQIGAEVRLSGGEAQRVSIARALLADPAVLVLDEATAFADPESEAAIQDALATLVADRTVLVIAHRLHTIVAVDEILVLDEGRIVQRGTHERLLGEDGLYRRLWESNEAATRVLEDAR